MSNRDIVHQMTDEMGLSPQMLQSMGQGGMPPMQGGMPPMQGGMPPMQGGMPPMQGGMAPGQPMQGGGMGIDFAQLSPEQQMMMMQQATQSQHHPPHQPHQPQHMESDDDGSDTDDSSDDSDISDDMDLDKLGLSGNSNGIMDNIFKYLKDPLVLIILFILFSLVQFDGLLKPMLPYVINSGLYYISLKGLLAGILFFFIKLVI